MDIYTLPNGELAAWCEDLGLGGGVDESIYWADDTFAGHVPVWEFADWYTCEFVAIEHNRVRGKDDENRTD